MNGFHPRVPEFALPGDFLYKSPFFGTVLEVQAIPISVTTTLRPQPSKRRPHLITVATAA